MSSPFVLFIMENGDPVKKLLQRYVSGRCTPEEYEQVFACLKTPEGTRRLKEIVDAEARKAPDSGATVDPGITGEIYARLRRSIRDRSASAGNTLVRRLRTYGKWTVAAVFTGSLILAAAGAHVLLKRYNTITYTTGSAQKEVIVLPDHSKVILNSNSSLSYPRNWENRPDREVRLRGEAFFDVTRNEKKPFRVTTSGIQVEVLGTSFNVKSYNEDETIETTLVTGKVEIRRTDKRSPEEPVVLKPNQKATYSKTSASMVLDEVKPELYTSWKNGLLIFEDKPFGEIARELERWYGVKIDIRDQASEQCRFTIKIKDEPLTEVLRLFSSTTSADYTIDGKQVVITGNLCH